jgi:hypothetical protein
MIDLHIYFAGLMTFTRKGDEMRALLVDARTPGRVPGTEDALPHEPVVQFTAADAPNPPPSCRLFRDAYGHDKGIWVLNKDFVQLDPALATTEEALDPTDRAIGQQEIPATSAIAESTQWLVPLRGQGGATAVFKRGLLDPLGSPYNAKPIVASVRLERGTLHSAGFTSELGSFVIWGIEGSVERAMTSIVEWRVTVEEEPVRLLSTKFDGSPGETLELKHPSGARPRIEVWILNMERDIIEQQRPPAPVPLGSPSPEYLYFDDLLVNPSAFNRAPIGMRRKAGGKDGDGRVITPAVAPCLDLGMKRLYFASVEGENAYSAPCSPNFG